MSHRLWINWCCYVQGDTRDDDDDDDDDGDDDYDVPTPCDIVMRSQENIQCMMKTDLFELEFQPEALQASALSMYH